MHEADPSTAGRRGSVHVIRQETLDDFDVQKNELLRLLESTHAEDKRQAIMSSLAKLEVQREQRDRPPSDNDHQAARSSLSLRNHSYVSSSSPLQSFTDDEEDNGSGSDPEGEEVIFSMKANTASEPLFGCGAGSGGGGLNGSAKFSVVPRIDFAGGGGDRGRIGGGDFQQSSSSSSKAHPMIHPDPQGLREGGGDAGAAAAAGGVSSNNNNNRGALVVSPDLMDVPRLKTPNSARPQSARWKPGTKDLRSIPENRAFIRPSSGVNQEPVGGSAGGSGSSAGGSSMNSGGSSGSSVPGPGGGGASGGGGAGGCVTDSGGRWGASSSSPSPSTRQASTKKGATAGGILGSSSRGGGGMLVLDGRGGGGGGGVGNNGGSSNSSSSGTAAASTSSPYSIRSSPTRAEVGSERTRSRSRSGSKSPLRSSNHPSSSSFSSSSSSSFERRRSSSSSTTTSSSSPSSLSYSHSSSSSAAPSARHSNFASNSLTFSSPVALALARYSSNNPNKEGEEDGERELRWGAPLSNVEATCVDPAHLPEAALGSFLHSSSHHHHRHRNSNSGGSSSGSDVGATPFWATTGGFPQALRVHCRGAHSKSSSSSPSSSHPTPFSSASSSSSSSPSSYFRSGQLVKNVTRVAVVCVGRPTKLKVRLVRLVSWQQRLPSLAAVTLVPPTRSKSRPHSVSGDSGGGGGGGGGGADDQYKWYTLAPFGNSDDDNGIRGGGGGGGISSSAQHGGTDGLGRSGGGPELFVVDLPKNEEGGVSAESVSCLDFCVESACEPFVLLMHLRIWGDPTHGASSGDAK